MQQETTELKCKNCAYITAK